MKIYVLGYKGMLGMYVYTFLKSQKYNLVGLSKEDLDVTLYTESQLKLFFNSYQIEPGDVIINCIGVIKPQVDKLGTLYAIKVNSVFPHLLSNVCEAEGCKMIHITTDFVFSGKDEFYTEESPHDCIDVYGKTKSLGEPENCTIVRTSIIGDEIDRNGRSLIEWIKSMKNKSANGYTNHFWNGLTCLQTAKVFEQIIRCEYYWKGVKHVFSPDILTKFELVQTVSDIYGLHLMLNETVAPVKCDRSLVSNHYINFYIPSIKEQILEQFQYFPKLIEK